MLHKHRRNIQAKWLHITKPDRHQILFSLPWCAFLSDWMLKTAYIWPFRRVHSLVNTKQTVTPLRRAASSRQRQTLWTLQQLHRVSEHFTVQATFRQSRRVWAYDMNLKLWMTADATHNEPKSHFFLRHVTFHCFRSRIQSHSLQFIF